MNEIPETGKPPSAEQSPAQPESTQKDPCAADEEQAAPVILLIEDDLKFARVVEKIFNARGYEVVHAPTALEGLQRAEDNRIKLVLLDIDLPDLDGKVVATRLRARECMRNVPIIAVTAQDSAAIRRLIKGFGCSGYIPKPIDTRQFPEQILAYLNP